MRPHSAIGYQSLHCFGDNALLGFQEAVV